MSRLDLHPCRCGLPEGVGAYSRFDFCANRASRAAMPGRESSASAPPFSPMPHLRLSSLPACSAAVLISVASVSALTSSSGSGVTRSDLVRAEAASPASWLGAQVPDSLAPPTL